MRPRNSENLLKILCKTCLTIASSYVLILSKNSSILAGKMLTPAWKFFCIRVFFHGHWRLTEQQGEGGDHLFSHCTTFTRSLYHFHPFRHLFATLHARWLSHIFNCTACIYNWINWWCDISFCLFIWWFDSRILLQQFDTETGGLQLASTITLIL